MYEFLSTTCITATFRTQRKVSGSLEIEWMKIVAGHVCSEYGKSIVKKGTIFPATMGTYLISIVVWIHVILLQHSATQEAESTLVTQHNAGVTAPAIGKAEMLESWVEMGAQSSCYQRNHCMEYCTGKWFTEVKAMPDPDFSR